MWVYLRYFISNDGPDNTAPRFQSLGENLRGELTIINKGDGMLFIPFKVIPSAEATTMPPPRDEIFLSTKYLNGSNSHEHPP